jgi:hypothetical protein
MTYVMMQRGHQSQKKKRGRSRARASDPQKLNQIKRRDGRMVGDCGTKETRRSVTEWDASKHGRSRERREESCVVMRSLSFGAGNRMKNTVLRGCLWGPRRAWLMTNAG